MMGDLGPEYLEMAMESVRDEYGSLLGYVQDALGVTDDEIALLRDAYLEPAA